MATRSQRIERGETIGIDSAEYWTARQAEMAADRTATVAHVRFEDEWTREVTIARRDEWRARLSSGEFGKIGTPAFVRAASAAEYAQGWDVPALKHAIALHNL